MTTNLLSVIEQLTKAAIYFKEVDPSVRSHCTWNDTTESEAAAAIEAAKEALEQAQGEAEACPVCQGSGERTYSEGSGPDLYDVTAGCDECDGSGSLHDAYVKADKQRNELQAQITVMRAKQFATHPQATEPAPIGFNGLTQAETEATMSVRGLSDPAPSKDVCRNCVGQGWEPSVYKGKVPCSFCQTAPSAAGEADMHARFKAKHQFLEWNRAQPEPLVKIAYEYGVFDKAMSLYADLLSAPALPVGELTDQSNLATIAGLEASTSHLSVMVDELRALLGRALSNFKIMHSSAKPDEGPDMDTIIPADVFAKFVDEDAAIRYALNQTCHHDMIPEQLPNPWMRDKLVKAAQNALSALEYHQEQTRPIERTQQAIATLQAELTRETMLSVCRAFKANSTELTEQETNILWAHSLRTWHETDKKVSAAHIFACNLLAVARTQPELVPMTDDQIQEIYIRTYNIGHHGRNFENAFARAILAAAHGITNKAKEPQS